MTGAIPVATEPTGSEDHEIALPWRHAAPVRELHQRHRQRRRGLPHGGRRSAGAAVSVPGRRLTPRVVRVALGQLVALELLTELAPIGRTACRVVEGVPVSVDGQVAAVRYL